MAHDPEQIRTWRETFIALAQPSPDLPLMACALAYANLLQRGNTWPGALNELEDLRDQAARRCEAKGCDPIARATAVVQLLADEGFHGNAESYEDIANSFIDRVLETRRGLPITLSVLAIDLAGHCGADLQGIGFPGHFLVGSGFDLPLPAVFDPFNRGRRLGLTALAALYRAVTGEAMEATDPRLRARLEPSPPRLILTRMLRNLQHHYVKRGCQDRAAEVAELLSMLHPEVDSFRKLHAELRERLSSLN